jgi:hypothetical protein
MLFLELSDGTLILGLNLPDVVVPLLVEFLVFHDMSLLDLLSLFCLIVDQFFSLSLKVLSLQLLYSVLCHLSLYKQYHVNLLFTAIVDKANALLFEDTTYLHTFPPSRITFYVLLGQHYNILILPISSYMKSAMFSWFCSWSWLLSLPLGLSFLLLFIV